MTHHPCPALSADALRLETPRLVLEPIGSDDMDLGAALLTDPDVVRYVMETLTPEQMPEEHARNMRRGAGGRLGIWKVTERETGEKIGSSVLLPLPIEEDDTDWSLLENDRYPDAEIEIGYLLRPLAWGRGYATEACSRLLRFAFEQTSLPEIVATIDPRNVASRRVLLKCGLRDEGLRRAYAMECPGFRISRSEWEAQDAR